MPETFHRVQGLILHMLEVIDISNQFILVVVHLLPHYINVEFYVIQLGREILHDMGSELETGPYPQWSGNSQSNQSPS